MCTRMFQAADFPSQSKKLWKKGAEGTVAGLLRSQTWIALGRSLGGDIRNLGCFSFTGWALVFLSQGQVDNGFQEQRK